jgi:hypothetical protein
MKENNNKEVEAVVQFKGLENAREVKKNIR